MQHHGVRQIYAKKLAPNDNSKNQVYLGKDFSALNIIPHGEIYIDRSRVAGSKQDRPKASIRFFWVDESGLHPAPAANLILYPDYPEVRMSGFLKGCREAPSTLMTGREEGRVLFLGITADGAVLGYAAGASSPIVIELNQGQWETLGVFLEIPVNTGCAGNARDALLRELYRISRMGWIPSQKLDRNGVKQPYTAKNGGGYTLEAELGIAPNGLSEPDFMGWEVKQYGVRNFKNYQALFPVTLMTPEPTGGVYKENGVADFLQIYGYADKKGRVGRINFGGTYVCGGRFHKDTGVKMILEGFKNGVISDLEGGIILLDRQERIAARWSFSSMLKHWERKHAQAAYVPSICNQDPLQYAYGPRILLCEQTDFILFLRAFSTGAIWYDPGIKIEPSDKGQLKIKRRSQFRIKHADLPKLYHQHEVVDLAGDWGSK